MNRTRILLCVVISSLCLSASLCHACTSPPDVYISDWVHYVGPDEEFEFEAADYSGTDIQEWWWDYPEEADLVYEDDYTGTYGYTPYHFA